MNMNPMRATPLSVVYDLSRLSEAGAELTITANPEQRAQLALWAEVDLVETFEARVRLKRRAPSRFEYRAELTADITQSCVVTLEPVRSSVALEITRDLHLVKLPPGAAVTPQELSAPADEGPEEIHDSRYDLAGPLLEEFSLAVDPYPRAPGVAFESAEPEASPESPFAVLKRPRTDR